MYVDFFLELFVKISTVTSYCMLALERYNSSNQCCGSVSMYNGSGSGKTFFLNPFVNQKYIFLHFGIYELIIYV